jgi:hypothetical protein
LAARTASGWLQPGINAGDVAYFRGKRDELAAALEAEGRDPSEFDFAGQVATGRTAADRRAAVESGIGMVGVGATHLILGMPSTLGPAGLDALARECLAPLRERLS